MKFDLHIHSVLSPCGSLYMSPINIVDEAKKRGMDMIAISDHNSCLHCKLMCELGKEKGLGIICGCEFSSKEDVHCLCLFPDVETSTIFQSIIENHIQKIENNSDKMGYQLVVDKEENILEEVPYLLIATNDLSLEETEKQVHDLNGLFIPAHINRQTFSIHSQLGFMPPDLNIDAIEISKHITKKELLRQFPHYSKYPILQDSDAHYLEDIASVYNDLPLKSADFNGLKEYLITEKERLSNEKY